MLMSHAETEEATQRVRIGLTGLALVFVLVLLGTVIAGGHEDVRTVTAEATANQLPDEPLAELGVAPGQNEEELPAAASQ